MLSHGQRAGQVRETNLLFLLFNLGFVKLVQRFVFIDDAFYVAQLGTGLAVDRLGKVVLLLGHVVGGVGGRGELLRGRL